MLLFKPMVVTTLCFVAITVTGAPTAVDSHVLDPRSNETYAHSQTNSSAAGVVLPTLQQLVEQLWYKVKPDKSVFYSGPGGYKREAKLFANKNNLHTIWDYADPATIEAAADLGKLSTYWKRMTAAYSVASSGRVFVVMEGDPELAELWYKGTIWDKIEWPILQSNKHVTSIFRVNPLSLPANGVEIKPEWSGPPRRSV